MAVNSRWQVDKEAVWLIESPTYLSRPSQVYVDFIFKYINTTSNYLVVLATPRAPSRPVLDAHEADDEDDEADGREDDDGDKQTHV